MPKEQGHHALVAVRDPSRYIGWEGKIKIHCHKKQIQLCFIEVISTYMLRTQ